MPIPYYLAMTAAEFFHADPLPPKIAWMACHFSSYTTGLSNYPRQLPTGSLLILNDRTPVYGHDPQEIAQHMAKLAQQWQCQGILLDLQHPNVSQTAQVVKAICQTAPCPVGVSESYWNGALNCAVFLDPPPLHTPLTDYLAPWQQHTVWMEAAIETAAYTVTERGCYMTSCPVPTDPLPHFDGRSFCCYGITQSEDSLLFVLHRGETEWKALMASNPQIGLFVGLYQQWK